MREAPVGRVLVASLHQGIADALPLRLDFYENWLSSSGLRAGTIRLAPLLAVLSFLRQEGDYQRIVARAGEYAADWTVDGLPKFRRAVIKAAPIRLRRRLLLRLAAGLARTSYGDTRATAKLRPHAAVISLRSSVFCVVREPVSLPLCGFYAAAFARLLARFDMPASAAVVACRGRGEGACVLEVSIANGLARPVPDNGAV